MAIIFHVDLDAFFASCEKARRSELADRPVVVCVYSGRGKESGAVSAAGYDAREYGIHAGMPISQARRIAADEDDDIAFLAADKEYYSTVSRRIKQIIDDTAAEMEDASIDEAYADMSHVTGYEAAEAAAETLQQRIAAESSVTASIGIGPNKLVAKIASDREKPDGITTVRPGEEEEFLAPLPVDELHGVGPKTADQLEELGASTVAELRQIGRPQLVDAFGEAKGVSLYRKARGDGSTELEQREPEQLSRLTTLEEDTRDIERIAPVLADLAEEVVARADNRGWRYSTASAIIITDDLKTRTRSTSFKAAQDSAETLHGAVVPLVEEFLSEHPGVRVRRAGVRASGFEKGGQATLDGFAGGDQ